MESKTCSTTTKEREEKKRRKSGRDRKKCVLRSESWRPMMAVKEAVVASPILLQCCSSGTNESAHTYTTTKRKSWVQSYRFFRIASAPVGVFTLRVCVCVCVLALPLSVGDYMTAKVRHVCATMTSKLCWGIWSFAMCTRASKSNVIFAPAKEKMMNDEWIWEKTEMNMWTSREQAKTLCSNTYRMAALLYTFWNLLSFVHNEMFT
jgi:hypothetical protein